MGTAAGVVLLVGGEGDAARELAYAVERQLFDRGATCLVIGAEGEAGLASARAVAAAGGLAIAHATAAPDGSGPPGAGAVLQIEVATASGAAAVVRTLVERGWLV